MIRASKATVSTFALALLFCLGGEVLACSCVAPGPPCQEYWRADAVFVGLVKAKEIKEEVSKTTGGVEVRRIDAEVRVTFTITDAFRGVTGTEVDIFTNNSAAACGYNFERDRAYIVYAHEYPKGGGKLHTYSCSRTQEYSESSPDIAYAKSLAKALPGAVISGVVIHIRQGAGRDSTVPLANLRVIVTGKDKQVEATTDSEYAYFKWSDVPADAEKAQMKIVIDPNLPESKAKLK